MDEVLEKLGSTIIEEKDSKSEFEDLYKNRGKFGSQEERRKELLEVQKCNRNNKLDKLRGIIELVQNAEDNVFRTSGRAPYRPNIYVAGFNRVSQTYRNVLMLSEWMVEKPQDFNEDWFVTPCPKAVRLLVVANGGRTQCFTKYGQFKFEIRTALPGGNPCDGKVKHQCCVLDCFYQEKNNTMYILDLLAWNNQPMTDCDTEFRRFWLQSKMAEMPNLKIVNKKNAVVFTLLPMVSCTKDSFNEFMMNYPPFECNFPTLDGLLFYHKRAHYVSGETPLVGWLFPYMVPEVIGDDITVHESYIAQKPQDYSNQTEFIQKFEEKLAKKKPGRSRRNSVMDTTDEQEKGDGDVASNESTSKIEVIKEKDGAGDVMEADTKTDSVKETEKSDDMDAEDSADSKKAGVDPS